MGGGDIMGPIAMLVASVLFRIEIQMQFVMAPI